MDASNPMMAMKTKRSSLLRSSMMTPAERAAGRFMRAPDGHDAGAGGDTATTDAAAGDAATTAAAAEGGGDAATDAAAMGADGADGTLLGDAGAKDGEGAGDASTDADGGAGKEADTAAGAPEAYELKAPAGMTLDTDALALAEPVLRDLNLTNEQAQKLTDVYAQIVPKVAERFQTEQTAAITAQRTAWAKEARADPEIGGAHWDASIAASAKALDHFGAPAGSPFRQLLNDSGLGNHPEAIRMFAKIGKAIGEDSDFTVTDTTPAAKKDAAEILYPNQTKGA